MSEIENVANELESDVNSEVQAENAGKARFSEALGIMESMEESEVKSVAESPAALAAKSVAESPTALTAKSVAEAVIGEV